MTNTLSPGDVRVGRLFDGVDDAVPDQAAALTFNEKHGAELTIPYYYEPDGGPNPQYLKARKWFDIDNSTLPKTLVFEDNKGHVTLAGTMFGGYSGLGRVVGTVKAQATIFERPRNYKDEYLVREFISNIDGLREFARFSPVQHEYEQSRGENGHYRTTVVLDANESVEWETGGFKYTVQSNVAWHGTPGRSFVIDDSNPYISTVSESGAAIADHFSAHWAVRVLLSLVFGHKLAWRSHKLRDDEFPLWMMDGSDRGAHSVEVQMYGTVAQHRDPVPKKNAFVFGLFRLGDIGADGMRKWTELYSDNVFKQAVQPAAEVINGASRFLEPQLMMLAISLDRFGYYRFNDKRRRPMCGHIVKCLEAAYLDWPEIGSRIGIAKAISSVNNDLKHPDRESYPDTDVLTGVKELAEVIARAQLFDLLGVDDKLRQQFVSGNDVRNAVGIFEHAKLTVTDEGEFVRNSKSDERRLT
ncbi:MAG: hypothetical protein LKI58_11690 [Actinomyces sp.]|jgi:hypothetical protein|nr:hypothetical protein [Actinomyces sp.]MCI1788699.1 hypothetical protein [Actinomyces sp.]MCI1829254.1 hypothetical protein [Actinomyces sp.]